MAAYYPLDTGTGTQAYDVSTNENRGVLTNGPSWGVGQIGQALTLNGAGSTSYFGTALGALASVGLSNSYAGAITLGSDSTITVVGGSILTPSTLTLTGGINKNGKNLTLSGYLPIPGLATLTINTVGISGLAGRTPIEQVLLLKSKTTASGRFISSNVRRFMTISPSGFIDTYSRLTV